MEKNGSPGRIRTAGQAINRQAENSKFLTADNRLYYLSEGNYYKIRRVTQVSYLPFHSDQGALGQLCLVGALIYFH